MPMSALVLGTSGDDGTSPCVLLESAGRRLLFNATEGLQRLSCEHQVKLHHGLDAILLGSLSPSATAGLPGLLLLLGDAGICSVHILGPIGTAALVTAFTPFVNARCRAIVSEVTGDEVCCWRGLQDIFTIPLASGPEHEARLRATEHWLGANSYCFPQQAPSVDVGFGCPPAKLARTVRGADGVCAAGESSSSSSSGGGSSSGGSSSSSGCCSRKIDIRNDRCNSVCVTKIKFHAN